METNFFRDIAGLNFTGQLQLIIAKGEENTLIVSTILQNQGCGDTAKEMIVPFNLKGTPQELDAGYFDRITNPIEKASGLMDNMEAYLKQMEEAKKHSAMQKQKTEAAKKEVDSKEKKYLDAMAKVDELDKAGDPKQAWMKVPQTTDYPEHADAIRKRRAELSARFAPDLFGTTVPEPKTLEIPTETDDRYFPSYADNAIEDELDMENGQEDNV